MLVDYIPAAGAMLFRGWPKPSLLRQRKVRAPQGGIVRNAHALHFGGVRTSGTETSRLSPVETAKLYAVQAQIGGEERPAPSGTAGRVLEADSNVGPRE